MEELFYKSNIHLYHPNIILQGNSGSGKSIIAQKIMLDWASEKHYLKDFDLAFILRYEEVKCISEEMNLIELLSWNCSLTSDQISKMLQDSAQRVLFIIDGLDDLDELRFVCDEFSISSKSRKPHLRSLFVPCFVNKFCPDLSCSSLLELRSHRACCLQDNNVSGL